MNDLIVLVKLEYAFVIDTQFSIHSVVSTVTYPFSLQKLER
jgi:hypothetical protein